MERIVAPEILDELPADHPSAIASRRDLRRLNQLMLSSETIAGALRSLFSHERPRRIVEIGAGDGTMMLRVAQILSPEWKNIDLRLLDQRDLLSNETKRDYEQAGWRAQSICTDVAQWLEATCDSDADVVISNLFLHHFTGEQLAPMLRKTAPRTRAFLALEPARTRRFLIVTRMLWLIGCNRVTRHDAQVSVRAGFRGGELSRLWPATGEWELREGSAGRFSHLFVARRKRKES